MYYFWHTASTHPREELKGRALPEYECCVPSLESSEVPPIAQIPSFLLIAFLNVLAISLLFTSWKIYNLKCSVRQEKLHKMKGPQKQLFLLDFKANLVVKSANVKDPSRV